MKRRYDDDEFTTSDYIWWVWCVPLSLLALVFGFNSLWPAIFTATGYMAWKVFTADYSEKESQ